MPSPHTGIYPQFASSYPLIALLLTAPLVDGERITRKLDGQSGSREMGDEAIVVGTRCEGIVKVKKLL
jgi:hypothetical protein